LSAAYQKIAAPSGGDFDTGKAPETDLAALRGLVTAAQADKTLSAREREEVALIDAKIDMRAGEPDNEDLLRLAQRKLELFIRTTKAPEYRSEARGWLAHIHFLRGEQTAAGKIYLDELNRPGSNLSQETILNSLRLTYGYDGGPELVANLGEYFDTSEHAVFAIQLLTNPHWNQYSPETERADDTRKESETYQKIKTLLAVHADLLRKANDGDQLVLLGMRTALRMGDPTEALKIAGSVPDNVGHASPDLLWMLASAHFLTHDFAGAEQPLLELFDSAAAVKRQKAAAAYGLCGVYQKIGKPVEQMRFALWLHNGWRRMDPDVDWPVGIEDQSVYWAFSGFDLGLLLESEAPDEALEEFVQKYPSIEGVRLVHYALAVRRARQNRYEAAAEIYDSINARRRATRMREAARLWQQANRTDISPEDLLEAKFKMAEFLSANAERIYFNDTLWNRFQRYAFIAEKDTRLTLEERRRLMAGERKLKDDQEERWRAYILLKDVVNDAAKPGLRRKAALLAGQTLASISERFGRQTEIHGAVRQMSLYDRR
jgi:hypothetical protein